MIIWMATVWQKYKFIICYYVTTVTSTSDLQPSTAIRINYLSDQLVTT